MAYILKKIKNYKKNQSLQVLAEILGLWFNALIRIVSLSSLSRVYYFPCYTMMTETSPFFPTIIVLVHVWTKKGIYDKNKCKTKIKPQSSNA